MSASIIRQELPHDIDAVFNVVKSAFANMPKSNHDEHNLVNRLRKSDAFIPEMSIIAENRGELVGHILLTKVNIIGNEGEVFPSLTLAPISVLPNFQQQGIGSDLIYNAHHVARDMGFGSVILLGHASYYPRFGYKKCTDFNIQLPFDSPPENCMVIELIEDALKGVSGRVEYPPAFFK